MQVSIWARHLNSHWNDGDLIETASGACRGILSPQGTISLRAPYTSPLPQTPVDTYCQKHPFKYQQPSEFLPLEMCNSYSTVAASCFQHHCDHSHRLAALPRPLLSLGWDMPCGSELSALPSSNRQGETALWGLLAAEARDNINTRAGQEGADSLPPGTSTPSSKFWCVQS